MCSPSCGCHPLLHSLQVLLLLLFCLCRPAPTSAWTAKFRIGRNGTPAASLAAVGAPIGRGQRRALPSLSGLRSPQLHHCSSLLWEVREPAESHRRESAGGGPGGGVDGWSCCELLRAASWSGRSCLGGLRLREAAGCEARRPQLSAALDSAALCEVHGRKPGAEEEGVPSGKG